MRISVGEHGVNLPCNRPQASSKFENYTEVKQIAIAVCCDFILQKVKLYFPKLSFLIAL